MKKVSRSVMLLLIIMLTISLFIVAKKDPEVIENVVERIVVATPGPTPFLPSIAMPEGIVVQKLTTSGEMILVKMPTEVLVSITQENDPATLFGLSIYTPPDSAVYMMAYGTVRAGYDPESIEVHVDELTSTLTLTLPNPQIFSWDFDADRSQFEFHTAKEISIVTVGAIKDETVDTANQQARILSLQDACTRNVFSEVNKAAAPFFKEWFGNVFDSVEVITLNVNELSCP